MQGNGIWTCKWTGMIYALHIYMWICTLTRIYIQIGKILALANLAAACENKMTSELGFVFCTCVQICTCFHGNHWMCKSTFAPIQLCIEQAVYASDYMCGTSSSPFWQSASSSNTSLPRRSPEGQAKLICAQTFKLVLALESCEHFWSDEYCIAECIITKQNINITKTKFLLWVQIFWSSMKCYLHTCTFSIQTPFPGSTLFPQLRDGRILVLMFSSFLWCYIWAGPNRKKKHGSIFLCLDLRENFPINKNKFLGECVLAEPGCVGEKRKWDFDKHLSKLVLSCVDSKMESTLQAVVFVTCPEM